MFDRTLDSLLLFYGGSIGHLDRIESSLWKLFILNFLTNRTSIIRSNDYFSIFVKFFFPSLYGFDLKFATILDLTTEQESTLKNVCFFGRGYANTSNSPT